MTGPARGGAAGHALGAAGEEAAARWLERAGLRILARGFRTRGGEIDVVARDGPVIVFVEVKTRSRSDFGRPSAAVDARKRARLQRSAALFLLKAGWSERRCRFDVVEVEAGGTTWRVTHIADAFRPGD